MKKLKTIFYETGQTPSYGRFVVFWSEDLLLGWYFLDQGESLDELILEVQQKWPEAVVEASSKNKYQQGGQFILNLEGSELEVKVWNALLRIPKGQVSSYQQVAREAGFPKAVRAVASAVGRNPLTWIVPCHRVVRQDGSIGNYRFGSELKRKMLSDEGVDIENNKAAISGR